jgi:hypothetical protein
MSNSRNYLQIGWLQKPSFLLVMVVVVAGGVNGSKVGVVVVVGSCLEPVGKGMVGGGGDSYCTLLHCV